MSGTWRENVQRYLVRPYLAAIAAFIITSVLTAVFAHMISFSLASFVVLIALAMLAPGVIVGIDLERILGIVKRLPTSLHYIDERQPGGKYNGIAVFKELETAVKNAKEEILMLVADANLDTDKDRDSRRDAYFKVFAETLEEKSERGQKFCYKRIIQVAIGKQDKPIREVLTATTLNHCRRALLIDANYPQKHRGQSSNLELALKWVRAQTTFSFMIVDQAKVIIELYGIHDTHFYASGLLLLEDSKTVETFTRIFKDADKLANAITLADLPLPAP